MEIWNHLVDLSEEIKDVFDDNFDRYDESERVEFDGWSDHFWRSSSVKKCHLNIIDRRETSKLWSMHVNIFPKTNTDLPILGFDVVSGANKITGSFFDFSPIDDSHPYMDHFYDTVKGLSWNRPRELPEWAQKIFSNSMISVGNIKTLEEVNQLSSMCLDLIKYYIKNIENFNSNNIDNADKHSFYCKQQKLNPHLHRSLLTMGLYETDKDRYVNKILFNEE